MLRLLARGYLYKEIAAELFISVKTVETHASNVLRKLQLSNRHQLTRWAADRRLTAAARRHLPRNRDRRRPSDRAHAAPRPTRRIASASCGPSGPRPVR